MKKFTLSCSAFLLLSTMVYAEDVQPNPSNNAQNQSYQSSGANMAAPLNQGALKKPQADNQNSQPIGEPAKNQNNTQNQGASERRISRGREMMEKRKERIEERRQKIMEKRKERREERQENRQENRQNNHQERMENHPNYKMQQGGRIEENSGNPQMQQQMKPQNFDNQNNQRVVNPPMGKPSVQPAPMQNNSAAQPNTANPNNNSRMPSNSSSAMPSNAGPSNNRPNAAIQNRNQEAVQSQKNSGSAPSPRNFRR